MSLPDHYKKLEDREFLGHWDLGEDDTEVIIKAIEHQEVFNQGSKKKERKVVATFNGARKKMILNHTNQGAIARHHGVNPNNWIGKKVTLYRTTTNLKGDLVECIRIK